MAFLLFSYKRLCTVAFGKCNTDAFIKEYLDDRKIDVYIQFNSDKLSFTLDKKHEKLVKVSMNRHWQTTINQPYIVMAMAISAANSLEAKFFSPRTNCMRRLSVPNNINHYNKAFLRERRYFMLFSFRKQLNTKLNWNPDLTMVLVIKLFHLVFRCFCSCCGKRWLWKLCFCKKKHEGHDWLLACKSLRKYSIRTNGIFGKESNDFLNGHLHPFNSLRSKP